MMSSEGMGGTEKPKHKGFKVAGESVLVYDGGCT